MSNRIGIVGLGRVGMPVAEAYVKAGYQVFGYTRKPEVIRKFERIGGNHVGSPMAVAEKADFLIILVLNDQQVLDVILGDKGFLKGAKRGNVVVCMSTINKHNLVTAARACLEAGLKFVDCPFTGGSSRVPAGNLTLIMSAPAETVELVRPVMEVIGRIHHVGVQPGEGQSVKHCNQLLVGVTHAATMEVLVLAKKLRLNVKQVCEIISSGIGGSEYFRLMTDAVLNEQPSPGGLGQMCKDITIVTKTGRDCKLPLYVATAAFQYFLCAQALGFDNMEGADLIKVLERMTSSE